MNHNLNEDERELVKLVNFFRKRAEKLMKEGRLNPEHEQVVTACDKLVKQLYLHGEQRQGMLQQRETLKNIVKDNAQCPKCNKGDMLKLTGTDKHEKGWKCNRYKCRRCNIEFQWNRPNNPWDMVLFIETFLADLEKASTGENIDDDLKKYSAEVAGQMQESLNRLKPVIEESDREFAELQKKDAEMAKMIHDFKNYLLIEKIKMDSWTNQPPGAN